MAASNTGTPRSPGARLRWLLALAVAVALGAGGLVIYQLVYANPGCAPPPTPCTRVFFLGNSYTSVNDLPATFASLAWSGGHRVEGLAETVITGGVVSATTCVVASGAVLAFSRFPAWSRAML